MTKEFEGKVIVVTGGAKGIGKCICDTFREMGATVCDIDFLPGCYFRGDVGAEAILDDFADKVIREFGRVDVLVNNAPPIMKGIGECTYRDFNYALRVGIAAPFYLTKRFAPYFTEGASVINISSTRAGMSQPQTESYTAAKGGIEALTHALAVSLRGKARVNAIAPGWIDTDFRVYEGADATQQPVGRVGNPMDVVNLLLFLISDKASFITGETVVVDGGMTRQMVYHGDHGWTLQENEK